MAVLCGFFSRQGMQLFFSSAVRQRNVFRFSCPGDTGGSCFLGGLVVPQFIIDYVDHILEFFLFLLQDFLLFPKNGEPFFDGLFSILWKVNEFPDIPDGKPSLFEALDKAETGEIFFLKLADTAR